MTGLPKLPGLVFSNPTFTKFNVPQTFSIINGYRIPRNDFSGIGGRDRDVDSVKLIKNQDPIRFDPSLTYGRSRGPALPQVVPHFVLYEKKCLTFKAFFKQSVFESPNEHYRIRQVNIIYFLEDDSITVIEPFVRNVGFQQGRLVKRGRIPKSEEGGFWHWKDLNIGKDICINGVVYHTVDCDLFTREYMLSQGLMMNPTEDMPPDPYIQLRELKVPVTTRVTPKVDDKFRRFLEYQGMLLKFNAVWDNRQAEFGELKEYIVYYFLTDDTIQVKEVHTENDGCDPTPLLLKKMKLPKNWKDIPYTFPSICMEKMDSEITEYYQPKDLLIGETIFVLGRRFLLYDCDQFTRSYYQTILNITQKPRIEVEDKNKSGYKKCMPPLSEPRIGSVEDTLQNCFQTIPRRPRRDEVRIIANANKFLRYTMDMDWVHPEDSIRKFLLKYSLANGTCQIYEPPIQNSGIWGGPYLKDMLLAKPGSHPYNPDYYNPTDFYIGAVLSVYGQRFIITGADLNVYRYMQANLEKFPAEVVDNMRNYMFNQGYLKDDLEDEITKNAEIKRAEDIDKIGKEMKQIKTEREKCLERIMENLAAADNTGATESQSVKPVLDTSQKPYKHEVCDFGIKPVSHECTLPIKVGDKSLDEKIPCPESPDAVVYPKTKEELLQDYYDDVLQRHEEACLKAAKYKRHTECLPGTESTNYDPQLSEKVRISKIASPSPEKDSPCVKKTVRFAEPIDKCEQRKDDVCGIRIPTTQCDCTDYNPC